MNTLIECFLICHAHLWDDRRVLGKILCLPAWLLFPAFYVLALVVVTGRK
jgi:hypothetical protein